MRKKIEMEEICLNKYIFWKFSQLIQSDKFGNREASKANKNTRCARERMWRSSRSRAMIEGI